ncbi:hypothetical protein DR64_7956 [Paraburkholderia xenovorans LB400]|nr:hypothetical protein [Paraburkholderia xenovorans]AIP35136.1 hypothetical protein DR64_7956 [Paraburkholderia xenovorans LB400]
MPTRGFRRSLGTGKSLSFSNSKSNFNQVAVVTDYFFSKTTHLFFMAGWQRAGGATHQAQLSGTASSNNHQILLTAGIGKKF